jgi:probable phosphoglycerate mutase
VDATRVVAIRHGETAWNAEKRLQGQLDIGLNPRGREQAVRLAAALAEEGFAAVYASDLLRARATAEAFARPAGWPVVTDPGLRERAFGVFEGHTYAEIEHRWPEDAQRWRRREPGFTPVGGESLEGFQSRCVAAAARLASAHPGEAVALVTHGGVLDALYRAATRVGLTAPRSWELANASVNRLLYSGEGFVIVGWDDRRHMDE